MEHGYNIAANVICLWQDQVLLVKRGVEPDLGRWAFPGGHVEPTEAIQDGAFRELEEETGLSLRPQSIDLEGVLFERYGHFLIFYYVVRLYGDPPRVKGSDDASEAGWIDVHEASSMNLAFDHNHVLANVLKGKFWYA